MTFFACRKGSRQFFQISTGTGTQWEHYKCAVCIEPIFIYVLPSSDLQLFVKSKPTAIHSPGQGSLKAEVRSKVRADGIDLSSQNTGWVSKQTMVLAKAALPSPILGARSH